MRKIYSLPVVLLFTFSIFSSSVHAQAAFQETTYASGINTPTAMEFAPDGRLFVAEKDGKLRVIKNGVLLPQPFLTVSVTTNGERGLLGVTFDPNFSTNRYVYVYYTNSNPIVNRLSRFTASASNPDVAEAGSEFFLLNAIPSASGYHNGGAIHFGKDGKLYVAVGEGHNSLDAQDMGTIAGKFLRINNDGTAPNDNPFVGTPGARKEIWAFGLRNPFTFAIDPVSGKIHINDVGQNTWEEINLGVSGANYGWPTCEGPRNTGVGTCTSSSFTYPIYSYSHDVGKAITGGTFYRGSQFPSQYDGVYFFADYLGSFIKMLDANNQVSHFRNANSPVDLKIGPDGSLYYASIFNGAVYKISYVSGNRAPTAVISANPRSGAAPLTVNFSAAGSSDPDNDALAYTWNFGDSSAAAGISVSHTYSSAGSYTATLTVSDGRGSSDTETAQISVGTTPAGTITLPSSGALYNAGDIINYSGTAADAEDGTLPASAFSWTIVFHHDNHTHPFLGPISGVKNGSFQIPNSQSENSANVWYRIHLTVTDSAGLTHQSFRDVSPRKSTISLASNINGIKLTLDGQPFTTPFSAQSVVGFVRQIGAASPQTVSSKAYEFVSWSDSGAQNHSIITPSASTTYTATYREVSNQCSATSGFASPCDTNGNRILSLDSPVLSGNNVNFNVSVNLPSPPVNAIYATGYYWSASQNQWISFTMTGTPYPGTDGSTWLMNTASKSLSIPTSAAINNVIYVVTWEYTYVNNNWIAPSCSNPSGCWRLATYAISANNQ